MLVTEISVNAKTTEVYATNSFIEVYSKHKDEYSVISSARGTVFKTKNPNSSPWIKVTDNGNEYIYVRKQDVSKTIPTSTSHGYSWWAKPRKVIVTKDTRIRKIKVQYPHYKNYSVKTAILKRGTVITTNHAVSYDWIIQKKGYAHNSHYFWVMNGSSKPNWITPYSGYWPVSNKSVQSSYLYTRKNAKSVWLYSEPGKRKVHNLKNYPHTDWTIERRMKVKNGQTYNYIVSNNYASAGWVRGLPLKPANH